MAVREACTVPSEELSRRLQALTALSGVQEAWLVSTCNRTEVLIALAEGTQELAPRALTATGDLVFRSAPQDVLYSYAGVDAVLHLFRVSAGLDSLILGESQILSQIKEATRVARESRTLGHTLEALLRLAIVTGKRVRSETSLGDGTLSVARAGVEVARHVVGRFEDARVVIIGAGETGRLVARHLRAEGAQTITFANRSVERAAEAAAEFDARASGLEELPALMNESDVAFACVDGAPGMVKLDMLKRRKLMQRDRPMVLVDLSVPRAIEDALGESKYTILYDLDDLARIVQRNQRARQRAVEESNPILLSEAHKFLGLRSYEALAPVIRRMHNRYDEARESQLDDIAGSNASPEMVKLAHRLTKHLLDIALDELKTNARESVSRAPIDLALQRFLDNEGLLGEQERLDGEGDS